MMLRGIAKLLAFLVIGNVINRITGMPIAGSVIGLILLTVFLVFRNKPIHKNIFATSKLLQNSLTTFLLPVGVGIVAYYEIIQDDIIGLLLLIFISAVITFLACLYTYSFCQKQFGRTDK